MQQSVERDHLPPTLDKDPMLVEEEELEPVQPHEDIQRYISPLIQISAETPLVETRKGIQGEPTAVV